MIAPCSSPYCMMIGVRVSIIHSIKAPGRIDLECNDSHTIAWDQHVQSCNQVELAQLLALCLLCLLVNNLKFISIQFDLRLKFLIPSSRIVI